MNRLLLVSFLVWYGLAARALAAESATPAAKAIVMTAVDFESMTLFTENDLYTIGTESDRYYTTGQKCTWMSGRVLKFEDAFEAAWMRHFASIETEKAKQKAENEEAKAAAYRPPLPPKLELRAALLFGQNMFTPAELHTPVLQTNDRPYAAWLYLSGALQARSVSDPGRRRDWLTVTGVDVGVVGPAAIGKQVQDFVHDHISDSPRAQGWPNQLHNEPGLNLYHQTKLRWTLGDRRRFAADAIAHGGFSLGNVATYLNTGATVRAGFGLPDDFGPDIIRSGADTSQAGGDPAEWGVHFFGGFDVRAVGRDISLDGNTFTASHHVAREVFVGDFQFGVALTCARWTLCFSQVRRTPEFKLQGHAQAYGSITLTFPLSRNRPGKH